MFSDPILIFALFSTVESAKILVVAPSAPKSHHVIFRPLIPELINHNHEVTVITTEPLYPKGGSPINLTEIDLHDLSNRLWKKVLKNVTKSDHSNLEKITIAYHACSEIFMEQLKEDSVLYVFRNKTTFDMVIVSNIVPAGLIFSHIFKAPVIFMSPFGALPSNMKVIGAETHPLLYPSHYHKKMYKLTAWEKINEIIIDITFNKIHEELELIADKRLRSHFGIDTPRLDLLKYNVHMLFLNVHPVWVHNQPVPPNFLYIWGIHNLSENILPKSLQTYLDSSKHGVIYISFGSIFRTSSISPEKLQLFLNVFSQLPYNILWKWDADELPGKSENIKISKWFPQYDILRHPNVKLFITHGGLQSTHEAINAGVPLIGIPQFSDQEYNVEKYTYFNIGEKLDYKSLTEEKLQKAIETVLGDYEGFKKNIIQLRTLMHDRPKPVLEQVIWRIEYLLRHGGVQHLRAPAANMSWVEYYELELVLMLGGLIIVGALMFVRVYNYLQSNLLVRIVINNKNND